MKKLLLPLLFCSAFPLSMVAQLGVENTQGNVTIRAYRIPTSTISQANPTFALRCVCDEVQVTVKTQSDATQAFRVTLAYTTPDGQSSTLSVVQVKEPAAKPFNLISFLIPQSASISSVTVNEIKPDPDIVFQL